MVRLRLFCRNKGLFFFESVYPILAYLLTQENFFLQQGWASVYIVLSSSVSESFDITSPLVLKQIRFKIIAFRHKEGLNIASFLGHIH